MDNDSDPRAQKSRRIATPANRPVGSHAYDPLCVVAMPLHDWLDLSLDLLIQRLRKALSYTVRIYQCKVDCRVDCAQGFEDESASPREVYLLQACRLAYRDIEAVVLSWIGSNNFTSAFHLRCKMRPMFRAAGTRQLSIVNKEVDRVIVV
jgi:hypothetical protein